MKTPPEQLVCFCCVFKVRPTLAHPGFFNWSAAFLHLFLYADSDDEALEKAESILELLPYERVGEKAAVIQNPNPAANWGRGGQEAAKETGLGIYLVAIAPGGVEDQEFEDAPFPGEQM